MPIAYFAFPSGQQPHGYCKSQPILNKQVWTVIHYMYKTCCTTAVDFSWNQQAYLKKVKIEGALVFFNGTLVLNAVQSIIKGYIR